jgi:hypothetical protein
MVCIPCIVIPALLFIWHKWLQPFVLRFWNPFGVELPKEDTWWEARQAKLNPDLINDATESFFSKFSSSSQCPFKFKSGSKAVKEGESEKLIESHTKVD